MKSPGWNLDINFNATSEWLGLLFADCAERYGTGLAVDPFYCPGLSASDHYPFWQKGWSAICGITDNEGYCGHGGNYPYDHTSNDTIANCGAPDFFYAAVRTSVAALAEMARPFKLTTDRESYACGSDVGVLVGDRDLNLDPGLVESAIVEAWSDTEPTPESFAIDERATDSMIYEGLSFSVTSADAAGNTATDDNAGAWFGFATGENNRNGLVCSGTCGATTKNMTATCP